VVVERYGKPMVAVIAYEDFVALKDELDDLRAARRAAEAYEAWKSDPSWGRSWDEVEADLVAEGLLDVQSEDD
jgi:PHD/YefM family antitoxin component YafN of YafNO toxin-antitoxin module